MQNLMKQELTLEIDYVLFHENKKQSLFRQRERFILSITEKG